MYNELYEAWQREKESTEIQPLSKTFYSKLAEYVRKTREESRMIDEKTTRAKLLLSESTNAKKMIKQLILLRREKALRKILAGEILPKESLTQEEEKFVTEVAPAFESFQALTEDIQSGRLPQPQIREKPKKHVLRFVKEIPAIVGADMKTYGPFKPEDIASLPQENAKILIKQGAAVKVEVKL